MSLKNTMIESELTNALYISDKGFYSESNIEQLNALQMKYIIPLRRNNSCVSYNLLSNITFLINILNLETGMFFIRNKQ